MTQWIRGRTVFQRVALALMVLAVSAVIVSYLSGGTSASEFVTLAFIVCYIAFRKELLRRVRNPLLLTYFPLGVAPIFLIRFLLLRTADWLLGPFTTQRVPPDPHAPIECLP